MKFLIAGLGSIGRRHLHNLLALGQRDILLYRTHQSTLPDADLVDFPVETDLSAALDHQPDAVIISNPTALHLQVAQPAAERGCHLLLEKPISHSLQGVQELQETVRRHGLQVLVGFQFRFHPGLQHVRRLLETQAVGQPLSVRSHWGEYLPGWHPWEDYRQGYSARPELGGGVILTLSHPLDYLRYLLGEVQSLWALTASNSPLNLAVEDRAEIGLQFESGVIGSVHLDYVQQPPQHWLEIICTGGTIRWDNSDGSVKWFSSQSSTWQRLPAPQGFERNQLFLDQMRHFLNLLESGGAPACTLDDGVRALELALAVHESAASGRRVSF
jgi:predicted dehydrogenase